MKILALDPGYGRCGIAVVERVAGGRDTLIDSACITTDASLPFEERLAVVTGEFRVWIQRYHPDVCAFERLFFTKNQKTAMRVAEARGAFILTAQEAGIPIHEYGPGEIKVAITGDGRATKRQIITMVQLLVRPIKKIQFDDEYDAIAVGLTAAASLRV
jgi:crossover junction endodeoxyribonuclease RuvC